jgi:prepilin-type N-terminal cleavage/methylation domain-containing protein
VSARRHAGFTLVELLLAASLAVVVLTAAWSWLWTVAAAAHRSGDAAEVASSLAFARRQLLRDAHQATALAAPATGAGCGAHALALQLPGTAAAPEIVQYAVSASRATLWRKTSSNYVAEGVTRFDVVYLRAAGSEVLPEADGGLSSEDLEAVRVVRVSVAMAAGSAAAAATWSLGLP